MGAGGQRFESSRPDQLSPFEGCAYQLRYLLTHPDFARQLGKNGREHVKENFLITTNLKRYLVLFQIILGVAQPRGAG